MEYKPTLSSFVGSSLYRVSPVLIVIIILFFKAGSMNTALWIVSGITILFSFYMLTSSIVVHLQRLYIDGDRIRLSSPLQRCTLRWDDIVSAVLRERHNAMTRTDRLLILRTPDHILGFNISTLSPQDEEAVIAFVHRKTRLLVQRDNPTL